MRDNVVEYDIISQLINIVIIVRKKLVIHVQMHRQMHLIIERVNDRVAVVGSVFE